MKSNDADSYNIHKNKKPNPDIGHQLYNRAMVKLKMHENQRIKEHENRIKEEEKGLTFQPKINPVSAKIVVSFHIARNSEGSILSIRCVRRRKRTREKLSISRGKLTRAKNSRSAHSNLKSTECNITVIQKRSHCSK